MVTAYPGRFAGVASVDLARPMDAVRELRRCVLDLDFDEATDLFLHGNAERVYGL